jgi:hypothetical protein
MLEEQNNPIWNPVAAGMCEDGKFTRLKMLTNLSGAYAYYLCLQ